MTECAKCSAPLIQPATGRPRRYCSTPCRKLGEHEVRRLVRRLERTENDAAKAALEAELIDVRPGYWPSDSKREHRRAAERKAELLAIEVQRLEGRLRQLVGGDADDGESAGP